MTNSLFQSLCIFIKDPETPYFKVYFLYPTCHTEV